jgi:hypothetical protein
MPNTMLKESDSDFFEVFEMILPNPKTLGNKIN